MARDLKKLGEIWDGLNEELDPVVFELMELIHKRTNITNRWMQHMPTEEEINQVHELNLKLNSVLERIRRGK